MPHTPDIFVVHHNVTRREVLTLDRSKEPPPVTFHLSIERDQLSRGQLIVPSGGCCPLGHLCLALGVPEAVLLGHRTLRSLPHLPAGVPDVLRPLTGRNQTWNVREAHDSPLSTAIWVVNDNPELSEEVREELLIRLFAEAGIALTFTGAKP